MPISARKLAASFWEHYGGLKLDKEHGEPQDLQTSGSLRLAREVAILGNGTSSSMAASQATTIMNVLHRLRSIEESQGQHVTVLNKLRLDMDRAASCIRELEFSHKSTLREMNKLLQRIGEQMAVSRRNEQEKVRLTFLHLREEMEEERNTCRLLQMQNKKLSEDLSHANLAATDACKELNRERKARELLEEVCNELAREIGEDKAEVEQLKQEQEESRERLEKELKITRMMALWREQKVRNKLEEAKLELEYGGKQGMPLPALRGDPEIMDKTAVVGECSKKEGGQTKFPTQVLERQELDNTSEIEQHAEDISYTTHLSSVPAWLDAHFAKDKLLNVDFHSRVETINTSGIEQRGHVNGPNMHCKLRRRLHTTVQQGQITGDKEPQARLLDARSSGLLGEGYCMNSPSSSSNDQGNERHSFTQRSCTPQKNGLVVKAASRNTPKLHDNASSVVGDVIDVTLDMQERKPLEFSSFGRHSIVENGPSRLGTLLNDASSTWSPKKHSSSARFEFGKLSSTSEADVGRKKQNYFSDDDASSYITSRSERGRKQDGQMSPCLHTKGLSYKDGLSSANLNDGITEEKNGGKAAGGMEDLLLKPLRGANVELYDKTNHKTNRDDEGVNQPRPDKSLVQDIGLSRSGDDSCCGVMSKCGQICKELKAEPGCGTLVVNQDAEGSLISGGQENTSKLSPWRSATGKHLQCLWPPSSDAFSIFGGAKKRVKAGSSIPVNPGDRSGPAQRHVSPVKQDVQHLQTACQKMDLLCMSSSSLGAHLIKARVCDNEKPPKTSVRISPLRRATSHG